MHLLLLFPRIFATKHSCIICKSKGHEWLRIQWFYGRTQSPTPHYIGFVSYSLQSLVKVLTVILGSSHFCSGVWMFDLWSQLAFLSAVLTLFSTGFRRLSLVIYDCCHALSDSKRLEIKGQRQVDSLPWLRFPASPQFSGYRKERNFKWKAENLKWWEMLPFIIGHQAI